MGSRRRGEGPNPRGRGVEADPQGPNPGMVGLVSWEVLCLQRSYFKLLREVLCRGGLVLGGLMSR